MRSSSTAFTLVETVVVIAIMTALAALVFASLAPSREGARRTACTNNLHQFGKAFALYAADNDGVEAGLGKALTLGDLGYPPLGTWIDFRKQYGLWRPEILFCP